MAKSNDGWSKTGGTMSGIIRIGDQSKGSKSNCRGSNTDQTGPPFVPCLMGSLAVMRCTWSEPKSTRGRTLWNEYCSDSEDLFGGYDSILEDSSFLVELDDAEQNERRSNAVDQQHLPTLQPSTDILADSILDSLGDEPFQDLPGSQIQFQEQVHEMMKRSRLEEGGNTSTPVRNWDRTETERQGRARRTDQLKRTMLCNAAAPSHVSRTVALKEAVVCEEISVAMQAIETVSAETTDLGPFFGLPSKVKDLMDKLRGIQSLYGEAPLSH